MPQKQLDVAFIGGPQYDALYSRLPQFEQETGFTVNVCVQLPHPELNAHIDAVYTAGSARYDVISTHVKYAPAQQAWLLPLDTYFSDAELADFSPALLKHARVNGVLLQVPRNVDARILFYRRDLLTDPAEQARFQRQYGRPLRVPQTWDEVRDVASLFHAAARFVWLCFSRSFIRAIRHLLRIGGHGGWDSFRCATQPLIQYLCRSLGAWLPRRPLPAGPDSARSGGHLLR